MPLSEELRRAVAADKRTRNAIAKAAEMTPVTLSRFMTDPEYDLRVSASERLAKVLGFGITLVARPSRRRSKP